METRPDVKEDFRDPSALKKPPKAVADGIGGVIIACAEVAGTPDEVYRALTTSEVEKWWKFPGLYHQQDWRAEVQVGGKWSVTVVIDDGNLVHAWGEFCELRAPNKIVMTRRFDGHPGLGDRETTISYQLQPSSHGTLITVREEGLIGLAKTAFGNAEIWEKVLSWLDSYLGSRKG